MVSWKQEMMRDHPYHPHFKNKKQKIHLLEFLWGTVEPPRLYQEMLGLAEVRPAAKLSDLRQMTHPL